MFQIAIVAVLLTAVPYPPDGQGSAQDEAHVQTVVPPEDSITVPDGTPITLELAGEVTSEAAKVGDTVAFTTAHAVRIDKLVIVPTGAIVTGSVAQVQHSRRLSRDGGVRMIAERLILPSGELVTLRPQRSVSNKPQRLAGDAGSQQRKLAWWAQTAALNYLLPFDLQFGTGIPAALGSKGKEQTYSTGTRLTVYLNGPLKLNRGAVLNLQSPPYQGPAQVFFRNSRKQSTKRRYKNDVLFCEQKPIGDFFSTLRLELNPGTYSFRSSNPKEKSVQLEVQQNHQYWVERDSGGLFVKISEQDRDEIEAPSWGGVSDNDLTSSSGENSCGPGPQRRVPDDDSSERAGNL